jgi:putative transposase
LKIYEQCEILSLPRSSFYYENKTEFSDEKQAAMLLIKDIYEDCPFYGTRRIYQELKYSDVKVGRDRVRNYMKILGLKAIYPTIKTTILNKEHEKYPYLLKNLEIRRANQVWATDITYLKMPTGHVYFTSIIDWYSRKILSFKFSNTLDAKFCEDALNQAINLYGKPKIFNTDQGSQYTSKSFIDILKNNEIQISMDSVGRWADNIIIERFWRTLKYENFYLFKYENFRDLKMGISKYIEFYNEKRKHSSLGYKTPSEIYGVFTKQVAA